MGLSDFAIKRPIVAIVASLLLMVFGIYAATQLPVRETPNIDVPNITVKVNYPGASAEVVESREIKLLEDQISGIAGIKSIQSQSKDGNGNINIWFNEDRNIEDAANDVRDQVSRVISRLPQDALPPVIAKADPDSEPIMFIQMASTGSMMDLSDFAQYTLQPRLLAIDGVAQAAIFGLRQKSMRIWIDRRAMAARGLTEIDVENALKRENIELGAGMIESQERNLTLRTVRSYQTAEDFSNLVVKRGTNNYPIRLGEFATVEVAPVDVYSRARNNGVNGLIMAVIKQPGASTLNVAEHVRAEVELAKKTAPSGVSMQIGTDTSVFIAIAIREVTIAIGVSAVLVMLVIYLFLGTVRATFIPAVAVPISLIATAVVLWPAGFTINILTLLAMVLAIGLVVDDAIIVLENIHRRIHMGEPPLLAAQRGARQVGMAVVATTTVLVAVFVPVALMKGQVGSLFKEFALTMAVAVAFSMFVSLTLTPVLCSKILSLKLDHGRMSQLTDRVFNKMKAFYGRVLDRALDRPRIVVGSFLAISALAGGLFFVLPSEFTPREDRGKFDVQIRTPEGATVDVTDAKVRAVADLLKPYLEREEIRIIFERTDGNGSQGNIMVMMQDWGHDKRRSPYDIAAELQSKFAEIPGAQIAANFPAAMGRTGTGQQFGIGLNVGGSTFEELRTWRDALLTGLANNPKFVLVRSNFNETKPQLRVKVDAARAADLGVSVSTIGNTLQAMLGSRRLTTYVDKGEEYDVIIQGGVEDRRTPSDVSNIYVRSDTTQQLIPLSSLVTFEEAAYAANLQRYNRHRSFALFVYPAPGVLLGDVIQEIEKVAKERLPPTAELNWRGEAGDFKDNSAAIYLSFGLALVVVFLVLAAQFESFLHPLVIMMTVPLAVTGALVGLVLGGQSMNLFSQIGIIVLIGLAAKNGILIVEFTNQLRDAGRSFRDALVEASLIRFRPIVMTALATAMGALPLVLAHGAGSEGRRPIGIVIFAGVTVATVITLVVVPTFYLLLARRTGSPGRIAAELREYENRFPVGHQPVDHQPAE